MDVRWHADYALCDVWIVQELVDDCSGCRYSVESTVEKVVWNMVVFGYAAEDM